jgi:hypothetical protein
MEAMTRNATRSAIREWKLLLIPHVAGTISCFVVAIFSFVAESLYGITFSLL